MDNEWARLRQSMIGPVVTAANHDQLRQFYRENPLTIVPKSVPKRRFVEVSSGDDSVLDDGNDDIFLGLML